MAASKVLLRAVLPNAASFSAIVAPPVQLPSQVTNPATIGGGKQTMLSASSVPEAWQGFSFVIAASFGKVLSLRYVL